MMVISGYFYGIIHFINRVPGFVSAYNLYFGPELYTIFLTMARMFFLKYYFSVTCTVELCKTMTLLDIVNRAG